MRVSSRSKIVGADPGFPLTLVRFLKGIAMGIPEIIAGEPGEIKETVIAENPVDLPAIPMRFWTWPMT